MWVHNVNGLKMWAKKDAYDNINEEQLYNVRIQNIWYVDGKFVLYEEEKFGVHESEIPKLIEKMRNNFQMSKRFSKFLKKERAFEKFLKETKLISEENRIKKIRSLSKLSQKKFADLFSIPLQTLQEWEEGKNNTPDYLVNLIEYYLIQENYIKE